MTVHYKNLLEMGSLLETNTMIEEEEDKSFDEEKKVEVEDTKVNLRPLTRKEKAGKWGRILLAILILFFFAYDAIWADPYLALHYYKVIKDCCYYHNAN